MMQTCTTKLESHPDCTLCPLYMQVSYNVGVPTKVLGPPRPSAILWVGMNPGYHEDKNNEPFFPVTETDNYTGEQRPNAGWVFHNAYLAVDPRPYRCTHYISNMVRCGPEPNPPVFARKACWPYLLYDFVLITTTHQRIAVVLLGDYAANHFTGFALGTKQSLRTIMQNQAQRITINNADVTLFGTWHPAFILRKAAAIHAVEQHLSLLDDWIEDKLATPTRPLIVPTRSPLVL